MLGENGTGAVDLVSADKRILDERQVYAVSIRDCVVRDCHVLARGEVEVVRRDSRDRLAICAIYIANLVVVQLVGLIDGQVVLPCRFAGYS